MQKEKEESMVKVSVQDEMALENASTRNAVGAWKAEKKDLYGQRGKELLSGRKGGRGLAAQEGEKIERRGGNNAGS